MPRPNPRIIKTIEALDGSTWDITQADAQYIITYQGRPCGVRHHITSLTSNSFKYQKLSYTGLGNARAQVKRLNDKFNTTDFDVMAVVTD
jgi:hypothetical protein